MSAFSKADWTPKTLSVCMAYDAFRLALGGKPAHFTPKQIVRWLSLVSDGKAPAPEASAEAKTERTQPTLKDK